MNKKFLSAILFGALMVTSTGTFVSCKDYDDDIDNVQSQVDTNASAISTLNSQLSSLQSALTTAQSTADSAVKAAADAAAAAKAAQSTGDDALAQAKAAQAAAEAASAAAAQAKVDAIAEAIKEVEALKTWVEAQNYVTEDELAAALTPISAKIEGIQAGLDEIWVYINEKLSADDQAAFKAIMALQEDLDLQKETLDNYKKLIEELTEQDATLQSWININSQTIQTVADDLGAAQSEIEKLWAQIGGGDSSIAEQVAALQAALADVEQMNATQDEWIGTISKLSQTLVEDLDAAKTEITKLWAEIEAKDSEFRTEIQKVYNEITALSGNLATLKTFVKGRLTSMLFAPSFYADGIEAIPFRVLKYTPWIDLKKDAADGEGTITLSDGSTEAYYFVSPSNVDVESIESLNVLLNDAKNSVSGRAAGDKVTATFAGIEAGKMKVNLKKNTTETFAGAGDEFTIMALQAVLTAEEGEDNALVTSDWARIYESHTTPYIHTTDSTVAEADVHFWNYNTAIEAKAGELVVKEVEYNKSLDLHELVTVCLDDEETLTAEEIAGYGMKFEFALVEEYTLKYKNEEETKQANFAVIDENGVITSRANDNVTENNPDAIGREPLVQVTLIDTNNEDNVIDVKYFKIKWIAVTNSVDLKELAKFTVDYACDSVYADTVKTDIMNAIYTKLEMSKEEFHVMYMPDNAPYGFIVRDAENNVVDSCGAAIEVVAKGSTTTYNIAWHSHGPVTISQAEWEAGKAVRTIYLKYVNQANPAETISFSLTREFNIEGMDLVGGYVQTYWKKGTLSSSNETKQFQVNPALTSDESYGIDKKYDCRIITNLLNGYNVEGITAKDLRVKDIVSENVSGAKFVFDEERVAKFGEEYKETWTVDGTQLLINGEPAAEITMLKSGEDYVPYIKLYEDPMPTKTTAGEPTEAAKSLVGKNVPVKLVATHCSGFTTVLDKFEVNFIDPLAVTLEETSGKLQDLKAGGDILDITKFVTVAEKFGDMNKVVYINEAGELKVNTTLVQWYGVKDATWDLANAKTNLKKNGNNIEIVEGDFTSDFSAYSDKYQLEEVELEDGGRGLKFHNFTQTHLQQEFKVQIPVYVATKWNSTLKGQVEYFEVTIVPGNTGVTE